MYEELGQRVKVCRSYAKKVCNESLEEGGFMDATSGVEVKKIKSLIAGVSMVKATKKHKRAAQTDTPRARSLSPSAEPTARGGIFGWF